MKNYTSNVPVETTIARIEKALAKAGATGVMKEYENGEVVSLHFEVFEPTAQRRITFRLPANVPAVKEILASGVRRPRAATYRTLSTEERISQQAGRTAWKIIQDWVEVQLSLIEMKQADVMQVFLPYAFNKLQGRTFYELAKGAGFKMLTSGKQERED